MARRMTTVEYCLNNVGATARDRLSDLDCTVERRCLQRCGNCYRGDFLVIDGELATGRPHATLIAEAGVDDE
jgi:uncharacterized protein YuzB (UPF0349 family)